MGLKFLLDDICLKHQSGYGHPENPDRIKSIINHFKKNNINLSLDKKIIQEKNIVDNLIKKIHDSKLINKIVESKKNNITYFDQDTIAGSDTFDAAHRAAGLAISAGHLSTKRESYFSIMRPPGHHATSNRAMGFCYFNNIALASHSLAEKKRKIAIIDFDFHYGNGTADIFIDDPNILFISIHADPTFNYPNQGFIDEIGKHDGKGFNICIPLSLGAGNNEIIYSLQQIVFPILDLFKPDIIGTSAGFDAFKNDPVGGGYLTYDYNGFSKIGNELFSYSQRKQIPIFHILEGGYNIDHLPKLIHEYVKPWMNNQPINDKKHFEIRDGDIKSKEKKTIRYVKQMLKPYWSI